MCPLSTLGAPAQRASRRGSRSDFLNAIDLTAHALALRGPAKRITAILAGERAVSADTALRLGRHFGTSAGFWLNLQKSYELEVAERLSGARIRSEVSPRTST